MEIRKFWITNGNNQTVQFADSISKIFINNPAGFGISNTLTTNQYTDRLDLKSNEQNFQQVSGEYLFYDVSNKDKYEQYNDFITFLTYKPLIFYYQIPTNPVKTYYSEVEVLNIDKSEVKTDGALRCSFSLQQLTRWSGDEITITGTADTYTINNPGHMPVGFEITINGGSLKNVYFKLEQDNQIYGQAKFYDVADVRGFDNVYVNSNDGLQNVVLSTGSLNGYVGNPLSYQDLSISNGVTYVTFLKLLRGESTLTITYDSGTLYSVEVKYTPIYRSV